MNFSDIKTLNIKGVIDRIEGSVVVLETGDGFMHFDKSLFPSNVVEGTHICIRRGEIRIDMESTQKAIKKASELLRK